MTSPPFFSIITPVYNRSDCIGRCIESVLLQGFSQYEMIIIDDGSNDETKMKVGQYLITNDRLSLISYEENRGVNYARNRGIEQATGRFILFLDSDDYLSGSALNNIFESITENPGYDHYLFNVSDRVEDLSLPKEKFEFSFGDWLSGRVSGDFTHVISPSCFDGLLFVEKFRIYEALNWMRVLKRNQNQLFFPFVASIRERNRADSVTRESILFNRNGMRNQFDFLCQFIDWYHSDFATNEMADVLIRKLNKLIMLGIALGDNEKNARFISMLKDLGVKPFMFGYFNRRIFAPFFYNMILLKSRYNQMRR